MTSKKIAATLGTGTLGAGAAGAAALNMGLGSEKSLEPASSDPSQVQEASQGVAQSEPPSASEPETRGNSGTGSQSSISKTYFDNATPYDIKAVNSNNWKKENTTGEGEGIAIKIEGGEEDTWHCTIKGIIFDKTKNKSQIEGQVEEFVNKIKDDETKRNRFVENCAKARLSREKGVGKESTIELEVEEESGGNLKLKDLDNLLEKEFQGLKRVEEKYQNILGNTEAGLTMSANGKDGKALITLSTMQDSKVFCSIYGEFEGADFDDNGFDFKTLNDIFMTDSETEKDENTKYTDGEKRKFLIRNCDENNEKIEGVKLVSYINDESEKKWKIENLEEKLLTKVYKNPEDTTKPKGQQEQNEHNASGPAR